MDTVKASWILEFVLRQPIDDWVANEILLAIPLPASATADHRLRKTILLRRIATYLSDRAVSEAILDSLEFIEELDSAEGKPATQSMRDAYSAVATECALSHLRGEGMCIDSEGFVDAVYRIWKSRIAKVAIRGVTRLASVELKERRKMMEAAVADLNARCRLLQDNEKGKALDALALYLKDTFLEMGPPFLEMIATEELRKKFNGLNIGTGGNVLPDIGKGGTLAIDSDECVLELARCRSGGVQGMEAKNSTDTPSTMMRQCTHEKANNDKAGAMNVDDYGLQKGISQVFEGELDTSRKPSGDSSKQEDVCSEDEVYNRGTSEPDMEASRKETLVLGMKISSAKSTEHFGEYGQGQLTLDMSKVKETLKTSCADLQDAVTDPLPLAMDMAAEILISMNNVAVGTNQSEQKPKHGGEDDPGFSNKVPEAATVDGDLTGSWCHMDNNEKARSSIMDRNPTARTYEWVDDSLESPERSPNTSKKILLASIKKRRVSPLKIYQAPKLTRRRMIKKWSVLEEDTLREAVKRHGKGNWKFILSCYSSIFIDRTEVDLKDKWRNMTRQ